jgi:hypothetical protein
MKKAKADSSRKFLQLAKIIAKRDRQVFEELMDYEKSGKVRTKERMNFTIDKNVAGQFKRRCRRKGLNMSATIENKMREIIEQE